MIICPTFFFGKILMKILILLLSFFINNISLAKSYSLLDIEATKTEKILTENNNSNLQQEEPKIIPIKDNISISTIIATINSIILSSIYPIYYYYKKKAKDKIRNKLIKEIKEKFSKHQNNKDLGELERELVRIVRKEIIELSKEKKNA